MNASRTARERVRAELIGEITDIARRHLGRDGAAGLSLRAVAREMGMVSSAIYRYFPSRDDLLTALIIDGYNAVAETVEKAEAACPRGDHMGRWLAVCHALRDWALAHPQEYALLYGSPVPGYSAPEDTIAPATRTVLVFGGIFGDAHRDGVLDPPGGYPPAPATFAGDANAIRTVLLPDVPDDMVARAVTGWPGLFGAVSFELFGQYNNVITDLAAVFEHAMRGLGRHIGFPD
ncbi:TetR/AcrR family transcriptional regulator [Actinomadura sp. DC4]|uniref:TetR/AcrR family transcriptional regulator n=1 Tax=Actinomadura sp. DC4 TaxID=3055069 RepID=UPI0025AF1B54|nr:TetR/AcrR family transcriptional regulator [Actinomadura sp. DC4]MDN3358279.1 TetR/AcrR family transcriptional regulator [Actinomadura sp. DC4]